MLHIHLIIDLTNIKLRSTSIKSFCLKRKAHGRPNQTALVIFDEFRDQVANDVYSLLDNHNLQVVKVPPNCTDRLQLMDLSINKSLKDYLQGKFQKSYLQDESTTPVDLRMSIMKPLSAGGLVDAYNYIKEKDSLVKNGYKFAGITDILNKIV